MAFVNPIVAPFLAGANPSPSPAAQQPARTLVKQGGYMICSLCQLAEPYCSCGTTPAGEEQKPPDDGPPASALARRIKECMP